MLLGQQKYMAVGRNGGMFMPRKLTQIIYLTNEAEQDFGEPFEVQNCLQLNVIPQKNLIQ